eukprot:scaffold418244_cov16-Prasinocladus_malaysianus.AAC.1
MWRPISPSQLSAVDCVVKPPSQSGQQLPVSLLLLQASCPSSLHTLHLSVGYIGDSNITSSPITTVNTGKVARTAGRDVC